MRIIKATNSTDAFLAIALLRGSESEFEIELPKEQSVAMKDILDNTLTDVNRYQRTKNGFKVWLKTH